MGEVLPFTGKMVRPIAGCQHDWKPIPMEMGCYECGRCRTTGYRDRGSGLILQHGDGGYGVRSSQRWDQDREFHFHELTRDRMQQAEERRILEERSYPDPRYFRMPTG